MTLIKRTNICTSIILRVRFVSHHDFRLAATTLLHFSSLPLQPSLPRPAAAVINCARYQKEKRKGAPRHNDGHAGPRIKYKYVK
jgi:hypothetical protein